MPKKTTGLAKSFSKKLTLLEVTRMRSEALLLAGHLSVDDVEQVYAGLFLDAFTEFEALVENLFVGLFSGTHKSSLLTVRRLFRVLPATKAREVVFEGKIYADWLPFPDCTIPRARRFLHEGEPFSLLDESEKGSLKKYHLLRNAVAHKSASAKEKFEAAIGNPALTLREKTPKGYLRVLPQGKGGLTQYQIAVTELLAIANKLCQ
jgi:hypothetical protein